MPVLIASRRALVAQKKVSAAASTFDVGFDFRNTSGYVTDPSTNQGLADANTSLNSSYPYPHTSGGVTFGVSTAFAGTDKARDRSTTNDPRLAGMWFQSNSGSQWAFRVDLPSAGTYAVRLALGDANVATNAYCQIKDGSTVVKTIAGVATTANQFVDATGAVYSAAAWPASNFPITLTMTGTAMYFVFCSSTAQTANTCLAHLHITQTG